MKLERHLNSVKLQELNNKVKICVSIKKSLGNLALMCHCNSLNGHLVAMQGHLKYCRPLLDCWDHFLFYILKVSRVISTSAYNHLKLIWTWNMKFPNFKFSLNKILHLFSAATVVTNQWILWMAPVLVFSLKIWRWRFKSWFFLSIIVLLAHDYFPFFKLFSKI